MTHIEIADLARAAAEAAHDAHGDTGCPPSVAADFMNKMDVLTRKFSTQTEFSLWVGKWRKGERGLLRGFANRFGPDGEADGYGTPISRSQRRRITAGMLDSDYWTGHGWNADPEYCEYPLDVDIALEGHTQ